MRKLAIGTALLALVLAACAREGGQTGAGQQPNQEPAGPIQVSVIAKEYGFDLRTSPEAGRTTFVLENMGEEPHEFGLVRITGDKSVEELIQLQDRADRFIEDVGSAFARPGKSRRFTVELTAGRYGYACFVTTHGQPHAMLGMFGEFEVA